MATSGFRETEPLELVQPGVQNGKKVKLRAIHYIAKQMEFENIDKVFEVYGVDSEGEVLLETIDCNIGATIPEKYSSRTIKLDIPHYSAYKVLSHIRPVNRQLNLIVSVEDDENGKPETTIPVGTQGMGYNEK